MTRNRRGCVAVAAAIAGLTSLRGAAGAERPPGRGGAAEAPAAVAVAGAKPAPTATEIIDQANKALRGDSSHARITMTVVAPNWSRDLDLEAWNQGREKALILIHAPPKDKGNTTLRRRNEMWVWMPKVERVMKVPPTMMHTSWMGSDFTYEDIVKADSIVKDYTHEIVGRRKEREAGSSGEEFEAVEIAATPKPDAPVVWGKVLLWCGVYADGGIVPLREEDYNERGDRVRTLLLSEIEKNAGRRVPTRLECVPERKPGQKTAIKYRKLEFDVVLPDGFFSLTRLQRSGG